MHIYIYIYILHLGHDAVDACDEGLGHGHLRARRHSTNTSDTNNSYYYECRIYD